MFKKKKNNKGQVAFYMLFIFIAVIIVILTAVASPFGATLATEFYAAGEELLLETQNTTVAEIQDPNVRAALNSSFQTATDSAVTNIEVANGLFQYAWVFLLVLVAIVFYLATRQTVAFQRIV